MGRKHVVKVSEEELAAVAKVKKLVREHGCLRFSEKAQATLKDDALGSYIRLAAQVVIESIEEKQ